jgi:D-sedoheptulose 7-phosphate isomerase
MNSDLKAALDYVRETHRESVAIQTAFLELNASKLVTGAEMIASSVKRGGKLLIMGNGGSAADAQHMAAEMIGRMLVERRPLPAIALTTDSSNLTAIGNDYGYEFVFLRQIEALARPEDIVLAISTSGKSKNVLLAVDAAKKIGCKVISLTGGSGGALSALADLALNVGEGKNSSRIQESHIFAVHSLVDVLDRFFLHKT